MIALPYLVGGAFAAGLAIGGFAGADYWGGKQHDKGYAEGVAAQKESHAKDMAALTANLRAEAAETLRKANEHAAEVERTQRAAIEAGRVAFAQSAARAAADSRSLRERVRNAEARSAVRRADGSSGLPEAAGMAGGTAGDQAQAARLLPEPDREGLISTGDEAELINRGLALCLATRPVN